MNTYKPWFWPHGNHATYKLLLLFIGWFLYLCIQQTCVGLPRHPGAMQSGEFMRITLRWRIWAKVNVCHFWVEGWDCWWETFQSPPSVLGWPRALCLLWLSYDIGETVSLGPWAWPSLTHSGHGAWVKRCGCVNHGILRSRLIYYCNITVYLHGETTA